MYEFLNRLEHEICSRFWLKTLIKTVIWTLAVSLVLNCYQSTRNNSETGTYNVETKSP